MAAGDITRTTPKQLAGLKLVSIELNVDGRYIVVRYRDDSGALREVVVRNGQCNGFDDVTGEVTAKDLEDALTRARAALLKISGVRALVDQIIADGLLVIDGTVG